MILHQGDIFDGKSVLIDGKKFIRCTFKECTLIYSGGPLPILGENTFIDCQWQFDGASARTLAFISFLHKGGGSEFVEKLFAAIKDGSITNNVG